MTYISKYNEPIEGAPNFTIAEMLESETADARGIENIPTEQAVKAMEYLARTCLQPARDHFGEPIVINSGYRSAELNKAVRGSNRSHHAYGSACDVQFASGSKHTLLELLEFFYTKTPFTELIAEEFPDGWVHIAVAKGREKEKKLKLKLVGKKVRLATIEEIRQL